MPNKSGRINEQEVAAGVLKYLAQSHSAHATVAELVRVLPDYLDLNDADLEASETRGNEAVWEQQVRNIISHRGTQGNAINDGLLEYTPKGLDRHGHLRITDAGRFWVNERRP
jgi:hypothetical protein